MGTYLSTPVVDKDTESGESLKCPISPVAWGVVDMQGWRKTMEDAHVACTDLDIPLHLDVQESSKMTKHQAKVFGVFDGHGGPEVARFCQLYLVDVIKCMHTWKQDSPKERDAVGQALVTAFHALDRMIDDPSRREELFRLQHEKPQHGERRTVILDLPEGFYEGPMPHLHNVNDTDDSKMDTTTKEETKEASKDTPDVNDTDDCEMDTTTKEEPKEASKDTETPEDEASATKEVNDASGKDQNGTDSKKEEDDSKDDDSNKKVGVSEEEQNEFEMESESSNQEEKERQQRTLSVVQPGGILEQILDIGGGDQLSISRGDSGQVEIQVTDEEGVEDGNVIVVKSPPEESKTNGPSASVPTVLQNGRQVCNLPEHPIHAGCTAVVGVLIGRTLTIANAGDSRAVLCREGGRTEPLSFDHKPLQEREMNRITKAGGFVNQFGRVNGNLNLSRSIGDLKYKQVPGISPAEQMITAQPDIVQVTLQPKDEFFILGCDGIWDCLTNEQAVQYVRERIDAKTPTEIGAEMLDDIISDDPRATQGIGGDNMTIMIVDLQPETRSYR